MNQVESMETVSGDLVAYARRQGVELGPILRDESLFEKDGRWIFFWRQDDGLHYNLQGRVKSLPQAYRNSAGAFRGLWQEAGVLGDVGEAYSLVTAWLLDAAEVDALPKRGVRQQGIG